MKRIIHPNIENAIADLIGGRKVYSVNDRGEKIKKFEETAQGKFFGFFYNRVNFYEDYSIPTAGVNITSGLLQLSRGMNFYYNPDFIESLDQDQLNYLLYHEAMHLIHAHHYRGQNYNKDLANIAMDLVINHLIDLDIIKGREGVLLKRLDMGIYFDTLNLQYKGDIVWEDVYDWLIENKEELNLDSFLGVGFDVHIENETEIEEAKAIVDQNLNGLRNRGFISGDMELIINKLRPQKTNYLKKIAKAINNVKSTAKKRSFRRPNRRGLEGKKGFIKDGMGLVCILDVSGSMSGLLDKVLSYIFRNDYVIHLIPIDTKVKKHYTLMSKKDFKKINVNAGGGTVLQPAVDYIKNNKELSKLNLIILTDGYTDSLNLNGIRKTLCISVGNEVPIKEGKNITQIQVENLAS